ncbi:histidine kinase N-terminal 7TM domain-containing protein [Halobaculum rubrum]|uniref:sensor histidine kinase n=1 Tax=Halobaculum rubrum TaxID=2872158 RepID=UPI001CA42D18|nr:histidine kinase N-terminal 7TM domain-containing protein [Halobaculum rubrum]QZY00263.1 histidine kinase [Halobaculum rubrum]
MSSASFYWYILAYVVAIVGCAVALRRARRIDDRETRVGLVALLVTSGSWATAQLGYLIAPTGTLQYALYLTGLIVGLTTIGGWLYFCSAYTGRSFHRNRTYRRLAVAVYVAIVAVKLTNPFHGLYFTAEPMTTPFPHLAIQPGLAHWVVTGLSYSLVAVGFFMLFDLFLEVDFDTRPLAALVGATALPVTFDLVEMTSTTIPDLSLEPVGVAAFAVGTLFVFEDRFLSIQLSDGVDDVLIYLDGDGRIREANGLARERFPELRGARGRALEAVLPAVASAVGDDEGVLERREDGEARYYLVSTTEFVRGGGTLGRLAMLSDVTDSERRRRELERQNDQLESLAAAMRHELLNTLQIVAGRVDIAGRELESGDVQSARESLRTASGTAQRMRGLVEDFADVARQGRTVEATESVPFDVAVGEAWAAVDTADTELVSDGEGTIEADADRLTSLLASAFRFGVHNGADRIAVELEGDGFSVAGDGDDHHDMDAEAFFEYGGAVPDAEAGIALPNVRTLARVHGWTATVDDEYDDGVRVVIENAHTEPARSATRSAAEREPAASRAQ